MFRLVFRFKSLNFFGCINTLNHKPFSIALSISSFENDVDDEFDKSFLKRRMLPKNTTLPKKCIVHQKKTQKKTKEITTQN